MLTLKEVNDIREIYRKYELSGDPIHLRLIYVTYGLAGALFLKRYDIAVTMIKKTPKYINSDILDEKENEMILNMLVRDFKHHVDIVNSIGSSITLDESDEERKDQSFKQIQMIIDICEEIKIKNYSSNSRKNFLLDIYAIYTEIKDFSDVTLINTIIQSNYLDINDVINTVFDKGIAKRFIFELGDILNDVSAYPDLYTDILNILILFYIRSHFKMIELKNAKRSNNEEERIQARQNMEDWRETIEDIKMDITESVVNLSTDLVIKVLNMVDNMGKYTVTFEIEEWNLNRKGYVDIFHDIKFELYKTIKEYIIEEINEIVGDSRERVLQDTYDEMTYEDGIRRAAILKFMREEVPDYNTRGFFDMEDEVKLLEELGL